MIEKTQTKLVCPTSMELEKRTDNDLTWKVTVETEK